MMDEDDYNYCVRCGAELDDDVAEAYAAMDEEVPALCRTCAVEKYQGVIRPVAEMAATLNKAIGVWVEDTFGALFERMAALGEDDSEGGGDDDSDEKDDGEGGKRPSLEGKRS